MIPWFIVKFYLLKHFKFCSSVFVLFVSTICFRQYVVIFLSFWAFLLGIAVSYSWLSADVILPNLLFMHKRKKKKYTEDDELSILKSICKVCGQKKCPRHRPELNIIAFKPWTQLKIRQKVDQAIEEFLNIVLKEHIYPWYKDISDDEAFIDELKTNFRFLASVFYRRAKKVDIPFIVSERLVKAGVQHLNAYIQAKATAGQNTNLQQATLELLGPNLHCAMQSRKAELEYLRRLTEQLFSYILAPQGLKSKCTCDIVREIMASVILLPALDAVANPDMVNNLLLVFLDNTPPPPPIEPFSPMVPFLEHFAASGNRNTSTLKIVMKDLEVSNSKSVHQDVLYYFQKFLKKEGAINVLQFCLCYEDFNKKILNPDLSQSALVELHDAARDLYSNYCAKDALDKIHFEDDIVAQLKEIVDGPPDSVIKLRTSTPLFKAYEHAFDLLEGTFLPLFHQSEEYYEMLCGSRDEAQIIRATPSCQFAPRPTLFVRMPKKKEFALSNIGTKIKGVFKGESKSIQDFDGMDENFDSLSIVSSSSTEAEIPGNLALEETFQEFHPPDMSTWRVTIPRIGARPDVDFKKQLFVYIIDVRRVDVAHSNSQTDKSQRGNWIVARRYHEFYVLESKLLEFHGELLGDCQLPSRKSLGTNKQEFIESRIDVFESFLQKLLTKPFLKGSQLLYSFLTSDNEFTTGFLTDLNFGKMLKAGAMKLVKEKGKHLQDYLDSFEQSTVAQRPQPGKIERRGSDASMKSTSSEKLCCSLYENNANYSSDSIASSQLSFDLNLHESNGNSDNGKTRRDMEGVFDVIVYIARNVYDIPDWAHHVLMTGRMLFKSTLEEYLEWYIEQKLESVTQEHRIEAIIHLLRDVLFFNNDSPRTDEEKKERYEETLNGCLDFLPKPIVSIIGQSNHLQGTRLILDVLQQPKLNKQLSYVFLDIVVQELFPELKS